MPQDMSEQDRAMAAGALSPQQEAEIQAQAQQIRDSGIPGAAELADTMEAKLRIQAKEKNQITAVDNRNYQYGGSANGANEAAERYRQWAEAAQGRQGVQIDYSGAQGHRQNALLAREEQLGMAGLMRARAMGRVPSIAEMQADRQMGQVAAEQSSAMASARGPAGLALAQQQAAANTANAQSGISYQAQINAAQERMAAEQAAFGAYSGVRGGDAQGQAQDAQQAQAQAALTAQQRQQNDAAMLGMTGFETGVRQTQLGADMGFQGQKNSTALGYADLEARRMAAKDGKEHAQTQQMIQTGSATAGTAAIFMSDVQAKQNVQPIGGAAAFGAAMAPPGQQDFTGVGGAGAYMGSGAGGAGLMGSAMTHPIPGGGTHSNPFDWKGLGQGLMGVSRSFAPPQQQYGGGYGMMLSDERAKKEAFQLGAKFATNYGKPTAIEAPGYMNEDGGGSGSAAPMLSKDPGKRHEANMAWAAKQRAAADPVTSQMAQGLAPSAYEYKPGMGEPGQKVGPMAQNMAANPITATAVRRDPATGLLAIDGSDGLKVALGGVGHLAAKQEAMEAQMKQAGLLRDVQTVAMNEPERPRAGEEYLHFVRGGR